MNPPRQSVLILIVADLSPDRRAITTSQIYLPTPPSKCSPRRSRRDGSASKHISSSRKNLASIISKAAPGLITSTCIDDNDRIRFPSSPPSQSSGAEKKESGGRRPTERPPSWGRGWQT